MVIIAGHELVDASDRDRYVDAFKNLVQRCRAFEGCIEVWITADSVDPARVNTIEIWESSDALDAWRRQASAPDPRIEVVEAAMRRYDATDGGPLF